MPHGVLTCIGNLRADLSASEEYLARLHNIDERLYEHIRYDHSQPWGACRIDSCDPETVQRHEREAADTGR